MKETMLSESLYPYMRERCVNIPHKFVSFSKIKKKVNSVVKYIFFASAKYRTSYKVKTAECYFINIVLGYIP